MKDWRFHIVPPPVLLLFGPPCPMFKVYVHIIYRRDAHTMANTTNEIIWFTCVALAVCARKKNENRTERREEEKNIRIFRIATAAKKLRRHIKRVREGNNVWMNVSDRAVVSLCSNARAMYTRRSPVMRIYVWTRYTSWAKITVEFRVEKKGKMWGKKSRAREAQAIYEDF